jgi:type IV pilus assembly protein PilC
METLLKKIAVFFDDEVDLAVKQLTTVLEPIIIMMLGGVVTFIVMSILQPMFAMYQGVSSM